MRAGACIVGLLLTLAAGCGSEPQGGPAAGGPSAGNNRSGASWGGGGPATAAVPVEVASVERRAISSYIETNGTLEAEYEVDIVARVSAPIVELRTEEGMAVAKGRLLARLDATEFRAQLEIARVELNETRLAYDRAQELQREQLISAEEYERARAAFESAQAQFEGNEILLGYTEIRAPFAGLIVRRYVDFAENVAVNAPLFRISDFTPLLCPIQVPERDLAKLRPGQRAYLTVESWPGERFAAEVLRISPVVDAATGTVKVTLEVDARKMLRPGMFARVFVETDRRPEALVIPRAALSLESIGDTVYVANGDVAARREVRLGFREGDFVEVISGVGESDLVVVVGQDELSEGTPVRVLRKDGVSLETGTALAQQGEAPPADARPRRAPGGMQGKPGRPDFSAMTPEQLERAKQSMRARGMTEEQIERRIRGDGDRATPRERATSETDPPPPPRPR